MAFSLTKKWMAAGALGVTVAVGSGFWHSQGDAKAVIDPKLAREQIEAHAAYARCIQAARTKVADHAAQAGPQAPATPAAYDARVHAHMQWVAELKAQCERKTGFKPD